MDLPIVAFSYESVHKGIVKMTSLADEYKKIKYNC